MRARNHDDLEISIEKRLASRYIVPPPTTLLEADQVLEPILQPAGQWTRVDERNPRLTEDGERVKMFSGFVLETEDLDTHDYRVAIQRNAHTRWEGDLKVAISVEGHEVGTTFIVAAGTETTYFDLMINSVDPDPIDEALQQAIETLLGQSMGIQVNGNDPQPVHDAADTAAVVGPQPPAISVSTGLEGSMPAQVAEGELLSDVLDPEGVAVDRNVIEQGAQNIDAAIACPLQTANDPKDETEVKGDQVPAVDLQGEQQTLVELECMLKLIANNLPDPGATALAVPQERQAAYTNDHQYLEPILQRPEESLPLRLLNSPETLLSNLTIKVYRGSHDGTSVTITESSWLAHDAPDSPWATFTYEYGPQVVWNANSLIITNEIRQQQEREVAERLEADLKAKKREAEKARVRAVEAKKVKDLEARQAAELERAKVEEAGSARLKAESKVRSANKGKERARHTAHDKATARSQPKGFLAPAPKHSKPAQSSSRTHTVDPALPLIRDRTRAEDILVPATPGPCLDTKQVEPLVRPTTASSTHPHRKPISSIKPSSGRSKERRPASSWAQDILVPPTPSQPQPRSHGITNTGSGIGGMSRAEATLSQSAGDSTQHSRHQSHVSHSSRRPTHVVDEREAHHRHKQLPTKSHEQMAPNPPNPASSVHHPRRTSGEGRDIRQPATHDRSSHAQHAHRKQEGGSQREPQVDRDKQREIGSIEAQQMAYEERAEERDRKRRKLEHKEARRKEKAQWAAEAQRSHAERSRRVVEEERRDGPSSKAGRTRTSTADQQRVTKHRYAADAPCLDRAPSRNPLEAGQISQAERDRRRKVATDAALRRQLAQRTRGLQVGGVIDLSHISD